MKIVRTAGELRAELAEERAADRTVGFVPTMGALHEGHLSLVRLARSSTAAVVVSIFVNPLQFGPSEDFEAYPRDEAHDLELLEREGVDIVFIPRARDVWAQPPTTLVSVGELSRIVEGAIRPGHFDGVATVVATLFNLVRPDVAYFGQKDAQQVAVIKKMVTDLAWPIEIRVGPTVRDPDGLALSSRNVYLNAAERTRATSLWRALQEGERSLASGDALETTEKVMWEALVAGGVEPDYASVVDPDTFGPVDTQAGSLLVIAAHVGSTRLIDNLLVNREA
ncbi:MAG TPA: pantoate--beta-alanine ligase [Actinomycetota bacterium]|nr:pantoate--beta-alanine ligase [Actinomycetota bacterium]